MARVLLVDDCSVHLMVLRSLRALGSAEVLTARTGRAALMAAAWPPHAVVLDGHLPDMNARDVLAGIRARAPAARVALFSASPELEIGTDARIVKDGDLTTLENGISALLRSVPGFA